MWKVAQPEATALESFRTCTRGVRSKELQGRMRGAEEEVVAADETYRCAAREAALHGLSPAQLELTGVTVDEMVRLYKNRMAKTGTPGRAIYDSLIIAAEFGRCPFCGHRDVSTLDHLLPKRSYAALAVDPWNLIPCCSDCNRAKGTHIASSSEEELLHPYFDDIEGQLWLKGDVVEVEPAVIHFYVDPPGSWPEPLSARVQTQFSALRLAALYAAQAAQELVNIRHRLQALFDAGGTAAVMSHLQDEAASRLEAQLNSWRSATYRAWSQSTWFCSGGFAS